MSVFFVVLSVVMWLAVVSLPWRPWSTRERLVVDPAAPHRKLDDVTVLIPARDEETCIAKTPGPPASPRPVRTHCRD